MSDLAYLKSCLNIKDTAYLQRSYYRYTQSGRHDTQRMLARIPLFEREIDQALTTHHVPAWIKYLPLAESRLLPKALSSAGAAGLWQIMPGTGRSLGLRIDDKLDERLHTGKASHAAAKYLTQLHRQFGDWLLALAAYNCGAGNVRKAQRRAKGYYYHEISRYLPKQTRRYIPRVLTIATIAQNPKLHGLEDIRPIAAPISVTFEQATSLQELATYFCCSPLQLQRFNPAFLDGQCKLENKKTASIYLPASVYRSPARNTVMKIGTKMQLQPQQAVYTLRPTHLPQFAVRSRSPKPSHIGELLAYSALPWSLFHH